MSPRTSGPKNTMNKYKTIFQNYYQALRGIELCIENKLILPSLSLIYSGIDIFSWVAYGEIGVKKRFTKWVEEHMYKEKKLKPRPIDLYAARCAILHTLTPDSDLSKSKSALTINYAWGKANVKELDKSIEILGSGQTTTVHLDALFESFKLGVLHFLDTEGTTEECQERMAKHYSHLDTNIIDLKFHRF